MNMKTKDLGNKKIMSDNIKRHLSKKSLNVKEFSEIMEFKYTTVLDWVNAKTYPRIDKIELMARYFGVDKSDLIEEHIEFPSTLSEITKISSQLEEPRQQVVLDTASSQLKEQEEQNKVKQIEDYRLSDEYLEEQISKASAYGGGQLNDNDKEFFKRLLKNTLKEKIDKGDL